MATQIQEILIDDLDGGEANETVTFAIDGSAYEIDLSDETPRSFATLCRSFVSSARRAGALGPRP